MSGSREYTSGPGARTGFEFDLTAGGSKIDLILCNNELEWDTTWDAVWDGEVAHDTNGWTAEFERGAEPAESGSPDSIMPPPFGFGQSRLR